MPLSENWKALAGKINTKKARNSSRKAKRPHSEQTVASSVVKLAKSLTLAKSPLAHALWITPPNNPIVIIDKWDECTYTDAKKSGAGKYISMDCEFVGVGPNDKSVVARVSLVNYFGAVLLDAYVRPDERVTHWRTWVSGVTPKHMHKAISSEQARQKVADILQDKILVGHSIRNDLRYLQLTHPPSRIKDIAKLPEFRRLVGGKTPALKRLCKEYLHYEIQSGEHSSVEDAQATMALFRLRQKDFINGQEKSTD